MKFQLERKISLGFGAAALVLMLVTSAAWWNVSRFQSTQYWVGHSRDVISLLDQSLTDVLDMQASTRGFVLTGDEEVLEPFTSGAADLETSLAELRRRTADNAGQQARLSKVIPLAARARELMDARIAARRARGLDAPSETAAYLDGQRAVEQFRSIIREMVNEERRLLDDRLDRNNQAGRLTVFTIVGASLVAVGVVVLAGRQVQRDFARRHQAEATLQESFKRIGDLYNHAPCGYDSLDPAGIILEINDTALGWLGYQRDEIVGRMNFAGILTPDSAARFAERFPAFIKSGIAENVEYEWQRKDGSAFTILLNATAVYDADGMYRASRATVFDVTLRKRAEVERDRFFTIARDLLSISDFDGRFKRVNPAWTAVLGFTPEELRAQPQMELVHPDDRERTLGELKRLVEGDDFRDFENRYRTRDGSYRWLRWSARAAVPERLVYASARDITEEKEASERIRRLHHDLGVRAQQLEAANAELESFSYSVSHDLRAPLRHVDGFANLLSKRAGPVLDNEGRRYVGTISKAAKQMGALIDDLLAFSRIGRAPLRREPVNTQKLIADIIADGLYDTPDRNITWEIRSLPQVRADPAMLRQVWANLIDNAVKYSSKTPHARITIEGTDANGTGEYVFSVRDNGVGFDMAYAEKLFGVFQRLHGPTEFEGTGIGLANVRRIVTRHGGRTWAESRVSEGATFYFSIPYLPPVAPSLS